MLVATVACDWKCLKENNLPLSICQNNHTCSMETKLIDVEELVQEYNSNFLNDCVIFAGLEPMLQIDEILGFITDFRKSNHDDVVIYTGYYSNEITSQLEKLKCFENIIVKFGRYIPDSENIYDSVLGINLISNNQYAEKIS